MKLTVKVRKLEAAIAGSGSANAPTGGEGSPEGVTEGTKGRTYVDTSVEPPGFWVKTTDSGSTGWRQLVG